MVRCRRRCGIKISIYLYDYVASFPGLTYPLNEQGVLGDPLHGFEQEAAEGKSPRPGILHTSLLKFPEGRERKFQA